MRLITRAAFVTAASIPLVLATAGTASAAEATDVSYAFDLDGRVLTNTITNNSGGPMTCTTTVALAPGGELPPIEELSDQTLADSGEVQPGVTTQTLTELPDGTYVALATCVGVAPGSALWVSNYPDVGEVLDLFPNESFAVEQASPVIVVPGQDEAAADEIATGSAALPTVDELLSNLLRLLNTGSAN